MDWELPERGGRVRTWEREWAAAPWGPLPQGARGIRPGWENGDLRLRIAMYLREEDPQALPELGEEPSMASMALLKGSERRAVDAQILAALLDLVRSATPRHRPGVAWEVPPDPPWQVRRALAGVRHRVLRATWCSRLGYPTPGRVHLQRAVLEQLLTMLWQASDATDPTFVGEAP